MADHYSASLDALDDVELHQAALREEYDTTGRREIIGRHQQGLGVAIKRAGIHAQLAQAQALHDLHDLLDERLRRR